MRHYVEIVKFFLTWFWFRLLSLNTSVVEHRDGVIIFPPDPWELTGSRGDEAMIRAVIEQASLTTKRIAVVVATDRAFHAAQQLDVQPLKIWGDLKSTTKAVLEFKPKSAVLIGADCMDGYYSPMTSAQLVATADIMARYGVSVGFTGFSFNDKPNSFVIRSFHYLSEQVTVRLRDPVSLQRFKNASHHSAHLVADAAFMMGENSDSERLAETATWLNQRRIAGSTIIAFNIHPHLLKDRSKENIGKLVESASTALKQLLSTSTVSVLLMAHDFRTKDADNHCLEGIGHILSIFGDRVYYPTFPLSAPELKALAGMVDGVITGRMHLAIASLGMGVPICAIAYQGKFKGLLQHFGYPDDMQISATDALEPEKLFNLMNGFINNLPDLKLKTSAALPIIKKLSAENFNHLAP